MRTVQEIKNIFDRSGGSIASPGAVSFNFEKVGYISIEAGDKAEETTLKIMDLGVDDIEDEGDGNLGIFIPLDNLAQVKDNLSLLGFQPKNVEVIMKPINFMPVSDEKTASKIIELIDKIESLDDVQKVFANFDIPDEYLKSF
jgi:transcriptional/translational regulatory protein YebC/TACO1